MDRPRRDGGVWRQHPRDLIDVRDLLANEGIGDDLQTAFIVYLVSSNGPDGRRSLTQNEALQFDDGTIFLDGRNNRPFAYADIRAHFQFALIKNDKYVESAEVRRSVI